MDKRKHWWTWRRWHPEMRDPTGAATLYPNMRGAYSDDYVPNQAPQWNQPTAAHPQIGRPFMTPGQDWRAGGWRT